MPEACYTLPGGMRLRLAVPDIPETMVLQAHVPGLVPGSEGGADLSLLHDPQQARNIAGDFPHMVLGCGWSAAKAADLPHLLYGMARRAWLEAGLYPVHAACVSCGDGGAILLVGHSGSGKTTLAQRLIERHGCKLLSGNKTLVRFDETGALQAVAGTITMTALDKNRQRFAWRLPPDQYGEAPTPVRSIAIVRLNDGVAEEQRLSPMSALHSLYPFFLDAVNADVIVGGTEVFDGAISGAARKTLALRLQDLLSGISVHAYSGSIEHLAQKVTGL